MKKWLYIFCHTFFLVTINFGSASEKWVAAGPACSNTGSYTPGRHGLMSHPSALWAQSLRQANPPPPPVKGVLTNAKILSKIWLEAFLELAIVLEWCKRLNDVFLVTVFKWNKIFFSQYRLFIRGTFFNFVYDYDTCMLPTKESCHATLVCCKNSSTTFLIPFNM